MVPVATSTVRVTTPVVTVAQLRLDKPRLERIGVGFELTLVPLQGVRAPTMDGRPTVYTAKAVGFAQTAAYTGTDAAIHGVGVPTPLRPWRADV